MNNRDVSLWQSGKLRVAYCLLGILTVAVVAFLALTAQSSTVGPKIEYIIYGQRLPWPAPNRAVIKHISIADTPSEISPDAGRTLLDSDNDEGINEFRLSPSGDRLLVAINDVDSIGINLSNLWSISVADGRKTVLRNDSAGYHDLSWSSDQSLISYISDEGTAQSMGDRDVDMPTNLYVQDTKTQKRRKLLEETAGSAWLPGRHWLVGTSFRSKGLILLSATGDRSVILREDSSGGRVYVGQNGKRLVWAVDHRLIILDSPAAPSAFTTPTAWKSMDAFALPGLPEDIALSPDGSLVALSVQVFRGSDPRQLAVLDVAAAEVRIFGTERAFDLNWSKDGRHLLFMRSVRGADSTRQELVALAVDTAQARPLAEADWRSRTAATPTILVRFPAGVFAAEWRER